MVSRLFYLSSALVAAGYVLPATGTAQVAVRIELPVEGDLVASDTVRIEAAVDSAFELTSVTAQIDGRTIDLAPVVTGWFADEMSLVGIADGTKTLAVSATNVLGDSGSSSLTFLLDRPPVITRVAPLVDSVAMPEVRVAYSCPDCVTSTVSVLTSPCCGELAAGGSAFDEMVSLATWDGTTVTVRILGTDSSGNETSMLFDVHVDSSPRLIEVEELPGRLLDADAERILYIQPDGMDSPSGRVHILDRTARTSVLAVAVDPHEDVRGFLTSTGAIVDHGGTATHYRSGVVESFPADAGTLQVSGEWAAYSGSFIDDPPVPGGPWLRDHIVRRNLATGESERLSDLHDRGFWSIHPDLDVADNGDVVWTYELGGDLYRNRAGANTVIGSGRSPLTVGEGVVFWDFFSFTLLDASGAEHSLASAFEPYVPRAEYEIESDWVAFVRTGPTGTPQVWLRRGDGLEDQISIASQRSWIEAVGFDGEVVYETGAMRGRGSRFVGEFGAPAAVPETLSSSLGDVMALDGSWHVLLGRSLFRISGASDATVVCGNGALEVGEQCDDGNVADGDGCSAACLDERMPDAGAPDSAMDGGRPDGSVVGDAGAPDGAVAPDAGAPDAMVTPDGSIDGGPDVPGGSGGCAVAAGNTPPWRVALLTIGLALSLVVRRRGR